MLALSVYASLLFLGLTFMVARNGPQLLKGKHYVLLNLVFLFFSTLWFLRGDLPGIGPQILFLFAALSGLSFFVRTRWFIFKPSASGIWKIIEMSFSGVLIGFKRAGDRYVLQLNDGGETDLVVRQILPGCVMISFRGAWQTPRAVVFQKMLSKRFSGI